MAHNPTGNKVEFYFLYQDQTWKSRTIDVPPDYKTYSDWCFYASELEALPQNKGVVKIVPIGFG